MLKKEYEKEIINVIKELVFLNSYDENLVGIYLYGYNSSECDIELVCFYKDLDKYKHQNYSNSYYVGGAYIRCLYLDFNRYDKFKKEVSDGVIIYDPNYILSNLLNEEILNHEKLIVEPNDIVFDNEFIKELIKSISFDTIRDKNDNEYYNSILNIYNSVLLSKENLCEEDYELFIGTMSSYNKIFMDKEEAEVHNTALKEALSNLKNNKSIIKKNRK